MRLPRNTIRVRLTLAYSALFLVSSAALLAITYGVASRQYTESYFVSSGNGAATRIVITQHTIPRGGGFNVGGPSSSSGTSPLPIPPAVLGAKQVVAAAAGAQSVATRHTLLVDSAIALGVMAVLSLWLGWLVSGRALRPLRTITIAAREISASNLHRRLALSGPDDELKQLGNTVDDLLARLEGAFEAQRQFVANASHELRTPLTFERTLIEVALADPSASVESLRKTCEQLLVVGEQQERLIEALLTLSRSQRGLESHEPVDLAKIAEVAVAAAEHEGLTVTTALRPAQTTGDPRLVDRLVANLVSNAIRHNVTNGNVSVETETRRGRAVLRITNTGPVIPPGELDRLFRPFQRLESGRSTTNGLGLGLSIVDAVAKAHDAAITPRALPEGGLSVEVAFPAA